MSSTFINFHFNLQFVIYNGSIGGGERRGEGGKEQGKKGERNRMRMKTKAVSEMKGERGGGEVIRERKRDLKKGEIRIEEKKRRENEDTEEIKEREGEEDSLKDGKIGIVNGGGIGRRGATKGRREEGSGRLTSALPEAPRDPRNSIISGRSILA